MPEDFGDKRMAGAASFLPGPRLSEFLEMAEQVMLKEIFPEKMFDMVVDYKKGLVSDDVEYNLGGEDEEKREEQNVQAQLQGAFDERVASMKKYHTMEEVNAVLTTIRRERDEVMDIWNREGGDMDEIIARVRQKTRAVQRQLLEELANQEGGNAGTMIEGQSQKDSKEVEVTEAEFEEKKQGP